jgi:hypothetical protein
LNLFESPANPVGLITGTKLWFKSISADFTVRDHSDAAATLAMQAFAIFARDLAHVGAGPWAGTQSVGRRVLDFNRPGGRWKPEQDNANTREKSALNYKKSDFVLFIFQKVC